MHLVGIGFAHKDWQSLVHSIQKHLPFETLVGTLFKSDTDLPEKTTTMGKQVADMHPNSILFKLDAFESPKEIPNFLTHVEELSQNTVRWILITKNENEDLSTLIRLGPYLELVNRMKFHVNEPKILAEQHLSHFPRMRLNQHIEAVEFTKGDRGTVRCKLSEMKTNTLIPFMNLHRIETRHANLIPEIWLRDFLAKKNKKIKFDQVKGILSEQKGCYLFPGISFNSIRRIYIKNICIHHILRSGQFNLNNVSFKRLIKDLKNVEPDKRFSTYQIVQKRKKVSICFLGKIPVINSLFRILMHELGFKEFSENTKLNSGIHKLDKKVFSIQLSEFNGTELVGSLLDWSTEVRRFLKPIKRFVNLSKLKKQNAITSIHMEDEDLLQHSLDLLRREKNIEEQHKLAKNRLLFFSQELEELKHAVVISDILIHALDKSLLWSSVQKKPFSLKKQDALLICHEESIATDLTRDLKQIERKWWINPDEFKKPEGFKRIDVQTLQRFTKQGHIVAKEKSIIHLLDLCRSAKEKYKDKQKSLLKQEGIIKSTVTDLKKIYQQKNQLALHWIYVSLKDLILRDLDKIPL